MQVKLITSLNKGKIMSIEDFVGKALTGDVYESSTERTTHNCVDALARLCDVLATNGILSLREVVFIAEGYRDYDMLEKVEE